MVGDGERYDDATAEADGPQPRSEVVAGLSDERKGGQAVAVVQDREDETLGAVGLAEFLCGPEVQVIELESRLRRVDGAARHEPEAAPRGA